MRWRALVLGAVVVAGIAGVVLWGPIPQDPAYHAFSDQRTILGIPHFWNVVSNAPFAIAGVLGLLALRRRPPGVLPGSVAAYAVFFSGAVLIAAGSAWYHLDPTNATLLWDRLPMTVSLMAYFAIIIAEHLDVRLAQRALIPLVAAGIAAAAWWGVSEHLGRSDLRAYAIVQFLPMALIPLALLLYPSRLTKVWFHWLVLACYATAKLCEQFDAAIHRALGEVSGHTLKHLVAAAGILVLVRAVHARRLHR